MITELVMGLLPQPLTQGHSNLFKKTYFLSKPTWSLFVFNPSALLLVIEFKVIAVITTDFQDSWETRSTVLTAFVLLD